MYHDTVYASVHMPATRSRLVVQLFWLHIFVIWTSVVVLKESPCPWGSSRTNFQVLVLVLVLGVQVLVLVLVLELQALVLVFILRSSSPRKFSRTE